MASPAAHSVDSHLQEDLKQYVKNNVCPNVQDKDQGRKIINNLKDRLLEKFKKSQHPLVKKLTISGSFNDDLLTRHSDVDVLLELNLHSDSWKMVDHTPGLPPDCAMIEYRIRAGKPAKEDPAFEKLTHNYNKAKYLSTLEVKRKVFGAVHAVCKEAFGDVTVHNSNDYGASVQVDVRFKSEASGQRKTLSLDFVPFVNLCEEQQATSKLAPRLKQGGGGANLDDTRVLYWRRSFKEREKKAVLSLSKSTKNAIKIFKTIRHHDNELHKLESFMYKMVALNMHKKDNLVDSFVGLVQHTRDCLAKGNIPLYGSSNINILMNKDKPTIEILRNYLDRIIKRGTYGELLKTCDCMAENCAF